MAKELAVTVKVGSYTELLKEVRLAIGEGKERAQQAVEQERVRTSWEIGKLIDEHILQHKERAGYAEHVLEQLAKDLGTSRTELSYMLQFARAYSIFPAPEKLSWAHYRELLSVNDADKRKAITRDAVKNKWSQKELRKTIRKEKAIEKNTSAPAAEILSPSRPGKPGTYRVILAKAGPYAGKLAIDLGFSNYYQPAEEFSYKDKKIINLDSRLKHSRMTLNEDDLFTYEAYVYEVLDGDTVNAVVDLGFGFVTTQTLRLKGIDAPEITTADGIESKKALERILKVADDGGRMADGKTNARVLIKTSKSDKYDRYLVDVFYPSPQKAGRSHPPSSAAGVGYVYVNQKLVDEDYAVVVED